MLTLRLPSDDYPNGLNEAPSAFRAAAQQGSMSDGLAGPPLLDQDAMADQLEIACRHGAIVEWVAARHGFLPSIIAGFCSRRSGWGTTLSPNAVDGTRDTEPRVACELRDAALPPDGLGFLRGLMGLDHDRHKLARGPLWRDPEQNIETAFALIAGYRTVLRRQTTLQATGLLRASLTAFECGLERVQRAIRQGQDVDSPSTGWALSGQGCGRDVLLRAGFFQGEGWD